MITDRAPRGARGTSIRSPELFTPGKTDKQFEIGTNNAIFGRGSRQLLKTRKLAIGLFESLFGEASPLRSCGRSSFTVACSSLSSPSSRWMAWSLLTQQVLTLHLAHLFLGTVLNLLAKLKNFQFMCKIGAQWSSFSCTESVPGNFWRNFPVPLGTKVAIT